jgi:hypothetical protein
MKNIISQISETDDLMMKENEKNACNDFIYILEQIKGVGYKIDSFPQEESRNTKEVEAILAPKDNDEQHPRIAVEHTIIEAHNNQILYVDQLCDIEKEINQKCHGKLPTGRFFVLIVPPSLILGMNKKNREQLVKEISCWILDVAKNLNTDQESSILYNNYTISLQCLMNPYPEPIGKVFTMRTEPEKAEEERLNRFRKSTEKKLPKLIKYKERKENFETALLLEDISFSYCSSRYSWIDLIPNEYRSNLKLIDYIIVFISVEKKMSMGLVWKEKSHLYSKISEIPDNRRFPLWRRNS